MESEQEVIPPKQDNPLPEETVVPPGQSGETQTEKTGGAKPIDQPESFTERQAESKVIPPANPEIRYPEVASIPPGQKSVIVIPKGPEVVMPEDPVVQSPGPEVNPAQ